MTKINSCFESLYFNSLNIRSACIGKLQGWKVCILTCYHTLTDKIYKIFFQINWLQQTRPTTHYQFKLTDLSYISKSKAITLALNDEGILSHLWSYLDSSSSHNIRLLCKTIYNKTRLHFIKNLLLKEGVSPEIINEILHEKQITELNLIGSTITDKGLFYLLDHFKDIHSLQITECSNLTTDGIELALKVCKNIKKLSLSIFKTAKTDTIKMISLKSFSHFTQLTELSLTNNGAFPFDFLNLNIYCPNLESLFLRKGQLLPHNFEEISKCSKLKLLNFKDILMIGTAPWTPIVHGCPKLEIIDASYSLSIGPIDIENFRQAEKTNLKKIIFSVNAYNFPPQQGPLTSLITPSNYQQLQQEKTRQESLISFITLNLFKKLFPVKAKPQLELVVDPPLLEK